MDRGEQNSFPLWHTVCDVFRSHSVLNGEYQTLQRVPWYTLDQQVYHWHSDSVLTLHRAALKHAPGGWEYCIDRTNRITLPYCHLHLMKEVQNFQNVSWSKLVQIMALLTCILDVTILSLRQDPDGLQQSSSVPLGDCQDNTADQTVTTSFYILSSSFSFIISFTVI